MSSKTQQLYEKINAEVDEEDSSEDNSNEFLSPSKSSFDNVNLEKSLLPRKSNLSSSTRYDSFNRRLYSILGLTILGATVAGITAAACIVLFNNWRHQQPDCTCTVRETFLSGSAKLPIPAELAYDYLPVRFNGTLKAPSIYRGKPNKALDDAWNYITKGKLDLPHLEKLS